MLVLAMMMIGAAEVPLLDSAWQVSDARIVDTGVVALAHQLQAKTTVAWLIHPPASPTQLRELGGEAVLLSDDVANTAYLFDRQASTLSRVSQGSLLPVPGVTSLPELVSCDLKGAHCVIAMLDGSVRLVGPHPWALMKASGAQPIAISVEPAGHAVVVFEPAVGLSIFSLDSKAPPKRVPLAARLTVQLLGWHEGDPLLIVTDTEPDGPAPKRTSILHAGRLSSRPPDVCEAGSPSAEIWCIASPDGSTAVRVSAGGPPPVIVGAWASASQAIIVLPNASERPVERFDARSHSWAPAARTEGAEKTTSVNWLVLQEGTIRAIAPAERAADIASVKALPNGWYLVTRRGFSRVTEFSLIHGQP